MTLDEITRMMARWCNDEDEAWLHRIAGHLARLGYGQPYLCDLARLNEVIAEQRSDIQTLARQVEALTTAVGVEGWIVTRPTAFVVQEVETQAARRLERVTKNLERAAGLICKHCAGKGYVVNEKLKPFQCRACSGTGARREGGEDE